MVWRLGSLQMRRTLVECSTNGGSVHLRPAHLQNPHRNSLKTLGAWRRWHDSFQT